MQPCGLRDLACPRGQLSFGLKTKRFAGYARSSWAQRALKNIHATLRAAGFGAPSEATVVWTQGRASCELCPRYLSQKRAKKHSCNPAGCGIWRTLGSDGRLASKPSDLRAAPAAPWPKGSKKTFMQPCGLRDLTRPWGRRSFGPKTGQVAGYARGTLAQRGLKKHSCSPEGCGS